MQSNIIGTTMPVLEFVLEPNEAIISESGELSWMGASIQMTTHTQMAGGGGFFGAIRRVAGGGSLFMTEYRAYGAAGELAFATKVPGHILPVPVGNGYEYFVHRHGFLCATPEVQIGVGFQQSLGAGIFGGDGFRLQHINGTGTARIELSGEVVTKDLRPGETLREHPGHVGAFQTSVNFQIARIPGISNMIFGGDGISSRLRDRAGPGFLAKNHLPISKLAHGVCREYLPNPPAPRGRGRSGWRDCGFDSGWDEGRVPRLLWCNLTVFSDLESDQQSAKCIIPFELCVQVQTMDLRVHFGLKGEVSVASLPGRAPPGLKGLLLAVFSWA